MATTEFTGTVNIDETLLTIDGFAEWSESIETKINILGVKMTQLQTSVDNLQINPADLTPVMDAIAEVKAAVDSGRVIPELTVDPND